MLAGMSVVLGGGFAQAALRGKLGFQVACCQSASLNYFLAVLIAAAGGGLFLEKLKQVFPGTYV